MIENKQIKIPNNKNMHVEFVWFHSLSKKEKKLFCP